MKKNLNIVFSLILVMFLVTGCGCNKKDNNKEVVDPNKPVINYKTIKNLKFGTASFYVSNGKTYVDTTIINETNNDIKIEKFTILFKDSNNKTIKTLDVSLDVVKKKETKNINESIDGELYEIANIDYEIK